jgi:phosphopantothenoylcysteine decarboxylase/phosphopantothenate--cysteine ligase
VNVLVTAGPTREFLDRVRFISNPSTGRMGFAFARAALARGDAVTVVHGPTPLRPPGGASAVPVVSCDEMLAAVRAHLAWCELLVMAAAPGDYKAERVFDGKVEKTDGPLELRLVRTPDILRSIRAGKGERIFLGFALEVSGGADRALRKLREKGLDAIVLNGPSNLGDERATGALLRPEGEVFRFEGLPKEEVAARILDLVAPRR